MKKRMLASLFFIVFLFLSLNFLYFYEKNLVLKPSRGNNQAFANVKAKNVVKSAIDYYYANSQVSTNTLAAIGKADARPVIINNFLASHSSPMVGLGSVFV